MPNTQNRQNESARESRIYWIAFGLCLAGVALLAYGNQVMYRYAVPPGYDAIPHSAVIDTIINGNYSQIFRYHTIWHVLTIPFVLALPAPTITTVAWLAPVLQLTTALGLFWVAKKWFSPIAGLAALVLISYFSLQPLQTLNDGGYPNVLAAGTTLPLCALFATYIATHRWQKWYALGALGCFIALLYSHHLTTLYSLPIFFFFALIMIARALIHKGAKSSIVISSFVGVLIIGLVAAWGFLHLADSLSITKLAGQFIKADTTFPFFHFIGVLSDPNALLPLRLYPRDIGYVIIYLGLFGLFIASMRVLFTPKDPRWPIYILLILWTIILLIGSRVEAIGYPVRLARDAAIPLALLGSLVISDAYTALSTRSTGRRILAILAIGLVILGQPTLLMRYHVMADHNAQVHHLDVDTQAADYITQNLPTDARIMVFQESLYLDVFTPKHTVNWVFNTENRNALITFDHEEDVFVDWDYVYLEEQHDIPANLANNPELTAYYTQQSPLVDVVTAFYQPEKDSYILKVNHAAVRETRRLARLPK